MSCPARHCRWPAGLLFGLVILTGSLRAEEAAYESLPEAKALAVSLQRPGAVRGLAHSQPNDLTASLRARQLCEAEAASDEACELVRLNDRQITTGADILARVPEAPHPLFLWRFSRASTVVYLAGSIHILKPSLYPLPTQLEDAFDRSDYLVLEVDVAALDREAMQRRTLAHALLPDGQTLADVLPASLHQRLDRHLADFGMNAAMLDRASPAMVMTQIVVSRLLTLGYLPDSGLENHFLSRRRSQQILELETLEEQLELMFDQPMDTQIQLLTEVLDVEDEIEPLLADMLAAWLSGDDAGFLEAFKAQSGDSPASIAFSRALLDDRNRQMAAAIRGYLEAPGETPRTYFVLVGAAHLVGEEGIVPLLARAGFHGERVLSSQSISSLEEELP